MWNILGGLAGFFLGGPIGAAIGAGVGSLAQGKNLMHAAISGLGAWGGAKLLGGLSGALTNSGGAVGGALAKSAAFSALSPYLGYAGAALGTALAPKYLLPKIPSPNIQTQPTHNIIPPPPKLPELRQQVSDVVKIKFNAPEIKLNNPLEKESIAPKLQNFNQTFGSGQLKNKRNIYNAPHFKPFKQLVKSKTLPKHLFRLPRQGLTTNARNTTV